MNNTYEDFIVEIKKITGIDLSQYKERQMKRRIDSLIAKDRYPDYPSYVNDLKIDKDLMSQFLKYITINVSEFFRNCKHWEVLEQEILPELLQENKNLRIWSAACSTGEEPYTLAMILAKFMPLSSINILATDIDEQVLDRAKIGVYHYKSFESMPGEYLDKYFIKEGDFYRIKEEVKRCVEFKKHNLLSDVYPNHHDLIICRNVLIYFTEAAKEAIYAKFNKALRMGGILFVGSTEQIIMCNNYSLQPIKTFFYKKDGEI